MWFSFRNYWLRLVIIIFFIQSTALIIILLKTIFQYLIFSNLFSLTKHDVFCVDHHFSIIKILNFHDFGSYSNPIYEKWQLTSSFHDTWKSGGQQNYNDQLVDFYLKLIASRPCKNFPIFFLVWETPMAVWCFKP